MIGATVALMRDLFHIEKFRYSLPLTTRFSIASGVFASGQIYSQVLAIELVRISKQLPIVCT
jgi:hypothetical protein